MAEQKRESPRVGWTGYIMKESEGKTWTTDDIKAVFRCIAKKWAFQLEKGKEGNVHFQVTFELKTKERKSTLLNHFGGAEDKKCVWLEPIVSDMGAWDYVSKADTRLDGPWSSWQDKEDAKMPEDIKDIKLYPWQESVANMLRRPINPLAKRKIAIIIDPTGGSGKSTLFKYIMWNKIAHAIDPADSKAMSREAYCIYDRNGRHSTNWIMNIGRGGMSRLEKKSDFWPGVEKIKDGYYTDDRYESKSAIVTCPKFVVFCNEHPTWTMLTHDRWAPFLVHEQKLVPWDVDLYKELEAKAIAKHDTINHIDIEAM